MLKRSLLIGGLILVGAIGLAVVITSMQEYQFNGVVYQNPNEAPAIDLTASDRQQFDLADHSGKIILAFFGYTSCPDVCPSTLSDMKRVVGILGEASESIVVLFITVDPERDTAEKLKGYVSLFDSRFWGLTGDEEELEKVWRDYGVFREIDTSSQTAAGYLVNHSSRIYLIDQDGRLFLTYAYGTPADDIARDVTYLLKQ